MNNTNLLQRLKTVLAFVGGFTVEHYGSKLLDYSEVLKKETLQGLKEEKLNERLSNIENGVGDIKIMVQENFHRNKDIPVSDKLSEKLSSKIDSITVDGKQLDTILQGEYNPEALTNVNFLVHRMNKCTEELKKLLEEISSGSSCASNKFISNFNINKLSDFLDSLTLFQESAFLHIILFLFLLCVVFNILGVLFGNEIIKYFNIEKKFPSLTTFLKLRSTYQRYYLMWNISLMFIVCFVGIGLDLLALYVVS